jgi:hypothetical protein
LILILSSGDLPVCSCSLILPGHSGQRLKQQSNLNAFFDFETLNGSAALLMFFWLVPNCHCSNAVREASSVTAGMSVRRWYSGKSHILLWCDLM